MDCLANEHIGHQSQHAIALLDSIKTCGKQKDFHKGNRIHAGLLKKGVLALDLHVGTALISMYAKCGALDKSQRVFDDLPAWDVVTWNALIAGYAQRGLAHDALNCFECMQSKGFSPDAVTFVCILKACGSIRAVEKGKEIHVEVDKQGLLKKHVVLGTALVDMYAKCGAFAKAEKVFDELPMRNVVSWNVLISGCVQQGLNEKALNCYVQMREEGLSPNAVTFVSVLRACGSVQAVEKGEEIHIDASQGGYLRNDVVLGTALIDMYAKCGVLAKAQKVFGELATPDVASWTALMAGYVEHGLGTEALNLYKEMRKKGLSPNPQTFVCVLKACASLKALGKGREVHAEVGRQESIGKNILVRTALVDMYANCGVLDKAQELFEETSARDVAMWNTLIKAYAQHRLGEEALKLYRKMQDEGLSPNAITFINVLKACASIGSIKMGEEIHRELCRQALLKKNVALGNALVDMYSKCGNLEKSQEVFNQLPNCDTTSWNALITGYIQQGHGEEALNCFEHMQNAGFSPDTVTFVCILKACGSIGAVEKGEEIHYKVSKQGLLRENITLGTAVVDMYTKCGLLSKARNVFEELTARDAASWNALISGYAQHGEGDEALNLLSQMQDEGFVPNAVTFVSICTACGSIGEVHKGAEIHAEVSRRGLLQGNLVLGNALVDMYAKCGALAKAKEVFAELPVQDVAAWNAIIGGLSLHGLGEEAWAYFEKMRDEGPYPDTLTYVSILQACGAMRTLVKGEKIHEEICTHGILKGSKVLGTAVVDMYAKCGALAKARDVFNEILARDVACWNALMVGYGHHELSDEVLNCSALMRDEDITPDATTFICILKACGHLGAIEMGKDIHMEVRSLGLVEKNIMLGNALVDMYTKCGALTSAQEVFDKLPTWDVVSWTALTAGYAQFGDVTRISELLTQMIRECIEPNEVTFFVLLTACSHAGLVAEGQKFFEIMSTVYSFLPTLEHYICMVDLHSRVGQFNMALSIIERVQPSDSLLLWLAVLGACHNWGNVELAGRAFIHALQVDEGYASAYVCMSNLYSAAGMPIEAYKHEALERHLTY